MRTETRIVTIGEWLGDVPADWDYEAFCDKWLGTRSGDAHDQQYKKAIMLFKEMDAALKRGAHVRATQVGGFSHLVYRCGLYDGWAFWVPRPCYSYKGPIPAEHIDEFYNLRALDIEE